MIIHQDDPQKSLIPHGPADVPHDLHDVIDGGHLLHSVVWPCSATYADYIRHT